MYHDPRQAAAATIGSRQFLLIQRSIGPIQGHEQAKRVAAREKAPDLQVEKRFGHQDHQADAYLRASGGVRTRPCADETDPQGDHHHRAKQELQCLSPGKRRQPRDQSQIDRQSGAGDKGIQNGGRERKIKPVDHGSRRSLILIAPASTESQCISTITKQTEGTGLHLRGRPRVSPARAIEKDLQAAGLDLSSTGARPALRSVRVADAQVILAALAITGTQPSLLGKAPSRSCCDDRVSDFSYLSREKSDFRRVSFARRRQDSHLLAVVWIECQAW